MATAKSLTSTAPVPDDPTLPRLREAAAGCTACPLHRTGTQTVFGRGPADAELMLVGEQPGDKEDLAGEPFVGPAGRLLDEALVAAGIDRSTAYVTNAVKHFKWEGTRGKVRLHKSPNRAEQVACRPWLDAELDVVRPKVVVCLGATAAKSLIGPAFKVTQQRGTFVEWEREPLLTATVHPSSILRSRQRDRDLDAFVADLRVVARALAG
jgi:uracil-DNA glycosylase